MLAESGIMSGEMPSPIGHALAGASVAFILQPMAASHTGSGRRWLWPGLGAALAALPDADLLIPHFHRAGAHSFVATATVLIVAMGVTRQVTGRIDLPLSCMLAAAQASHLLLDWLGIDHNPPSGIEALWPFSHQFYVSGLDWFPPVDRRFGSPDFFRVNLRALFTELVVVGPIVVLSWWIMRRRRSRVPTSVRDTPPPPSA